MFIENIQGGPDLDVSTYYQSMAYAQKTFLYSVRKAIIKKRVSFLTAKVAVQQAINLICVSVCLCVPLLKFFF